MTTVRLRPETAAELKKMQTALGAEDLRDTLNILVTVGSHVTEQYLAGHNIYTGDADGKLDKINVNRLEEIRKKQSGPSLRIV
jgi:hypothetical protein